MTTLQQKLRSYKTEDKIAEKLLKDAAKHIDEQTRIHNNSLLEIKKLEAFKRLYSNALITIKELTRQIMSGKRKIIANNNQAMRVAQEAKRVFHTREPNSK